MRLRLTYTLQFLSKTDNWKGKILYKYGVEWLDSSDPPTNSKTMNPEYFLTFSTTRLFLTKTNKQKTRLAKLGQNMDPQLEKFGLYDFLFMKICKFLIYVLSIWFALKFIMLKWNSPFVTHDKLCTALIFLPSLFSLIFLSKYIGLYKEATVGWRQPTVLLGAK